MNNSLKKIASLVYQKLVIMTIHGNKDLLS